MRFEVVCSPCENIEREGYEPFLFNREVYQAISSQCHWLSCFLKNKVSDKVLAEIHFILDGTEAVSLTRASYGSFQFSEQLSDDSLSWFISQTERHLHSRGVDRLSIRTYPVIYARECAIRQYRLLMSHGYKLAYTDRNFHLDLLEDFRAGLKESAQSRLRSLRNKEIPSELWEQPSPEEVYQLLSISRKERGYPLTISREDFIRMFDQLPGVYQIFSTVADNRMIAVGVTVHISRDILYNFYVGELPEYRKYSPVAGLIESMEAYGRASGYRILDLGIATDRGVLNEGLARFKINMGGKYSEKYMFRKKIAT